MSHDNPNFEALDWLTGEINETLAQARHALESYANEGAAEPDKLQACLELIHQVHGSLHMAELTGAAMLAEEMEQLIQALSTDEVENSEETREFLMRALLELPLYLDKVAYQRRDNAVLLLPLLNDLRAVRRERLVTEGALFSPDLSALGQAHGARQPLVADSARLQELVNKLRKMYHVAAAGLIRDVNGGDSLSYLRKVAEKMQLLYSGSVRQPLWQILEGLLEAIGEQRINVLPALRQLLRRIDVEFRLLQGRGAQVLDAPLDRGLVRNLLFYVYMAGPNSARCKSLYATFALDRAVPGTPRPDTGEALAMGPEAMGTAIKALREELDGVREALDPTITGEEPASLSDIATVAQRIADTLGVLGLESQRLRARGIYESLRDASRTDDPQELLLQAASEVVQLDSSLASALNRQHQGHSEQPLMGDATDSVLREARTGLESVKEAVVEYIASHWDVSHLHRVPERLQEVGGGLDMVGFQRAGDIVAACTRYIRERLIEAAEQPEWKVLDTLADAITSVEYYLERRAEGIEDADMLLALAEDSVSALGFGVDNREVAPTGAVPAEPAPQEFAATEEPEEFSPESIAPAPAEPESAPGETGTPQAAEPEPAQVADDDDENLIDEEILEIFLEEADEVLETIREFFPRWAADFSDRAALVEFRRGFHTLKGSGRMVEALDIGELAWAVENMLNRVIDETVKPQRGHVHLIEHVCAKLPSMIDAFRAQAADPDPERTEQLRAWAEQLAHGESPADLDAPAVADSGAAASPAGGAATDDDSDDNAQLWEIFAQETETHLATLDEFLADMRAAAPLYGVPSDPLHRALHTMKGSAHMADVTPVAELVTPLERFVKELRTYQVNIDEDIYELLEDGATYVREVLDQIRNQQPIHIAKAEPFLARTAELQERAVGHLIRERESSEPREVDPQLLAVIMADGMKVLLDADEVLGAWRREPANTGLLEPIAEELRVLEEAAQRAQLPTLAELSRLLLEVYARILDNTLEGEPALWASLEQGHSELLDLVDAVAAAQDLPDVSDAVGEALRALAQGESASEEEDFDWAELGIDHTDLPISYSTPDGADERSADAGDTGSDDPAVTDDWAALELDSTDLPTTHQQETGYDLSGQDQAADLGLDESLLGGDGPASEAGAGDNRQPTSAPDSPETAARDNTPVADIDPDVVDVFMEEAGDLVDELEELIQGWEADPADYSRAEALKRVLHTFKGGARMAGLMGLGEVAHRFETVIEAMPSSDHPGPDFFANAHGIYDRIAGGVETVRAWMAGDELEAFAELLDTAWADSQVAETPEAAEPAPVVDDELQPDDGGAAADETAPQDEIAPQPEGEAATPALLGAVDTKPVPLAPAEAASNVLPFVRKKDSLHPNEQRGGNRGQPQEMVRVAAELLEELVNLAGETSISRSRLEEQVSEFGFALDEMDSTITRLNEQLRRLDMETEAQILFRQEQLAEQDDNFDPLEMDRYSSIQQLSRSLLESTSDLLELRNTLGNKARDTETLLLQQSRVNTELQEGLMRSRMVPFSRLVPRLRRIVRQVSAELGKQVDLVFSNVEGELDRSMLERMVAPLEHMLRNAVDHGIELPARRQESGKPERGRITVALEREGSEVVLTIGDDGAGINLMKVREKAIERGLMRADAELTNNEILQFILQAGFSTADRVTQISGRGVGMDVVSAEIKQIGGTVHIDSKLGAGTEFTVRLPFTVSVNRALMVSVGDDVFALPLNTIEGIVRLSPYELEHYYSSPDARFEYAGEPYQVNYFGTLLQSEARPKLEVEDAQLPVLLVRSEGHAMALQVDAVLGSREIVVKSLGPQFAAVQGVSGATVTGDGTVVVILDAHALLRQQAALLARPAELALPSAPRVKPEPVETQQRVMVVDDSVTVRKVTTRFLEREGYLVNTAKDGQDAVIQLQDIRPDVILLDIEMPRMDGFEVARHIRGNSRLRDIPIIMITSRTGQKHRDHALSLGVNHYLGKPYQEEVLLEAIRDYTVAPASQ
ncbi:Hpt domain-containing protein [Microbulbifer yueqingensis]|uniref:Chemotaxis protein CheA n=1 Tax=Microbulbifer yueqingensis TaxID=658219 RepID=A0A1G9D0Q6_9GAMM|nr:Hpt domain-containing protein [Microbulbifer yueqingensis]SDK57528.1 chemosensory pili system protein ChpA (sensor histidine kinase/response regulator) [Microbulbifer yueqingensis]